MDNIKIKRALISVSDKSGIMEIATYLQQSGCKIISTGGTKRVLEESGIEVIDIQSVTGNPEAFDGRVKTISFAVESALLYDRHKHQEEAERLDVTPIDLVICNLYPFAQKLKEGADLPVLVENIDIGGPTMIRSAAKNYQWVTIITSPDDYGLLQKELEDNNGAVSGEFRFRMMKKAFMHTADYDVMIAQKMSELDGDNNLRFSFGDGIPLRYGENSHQKAMLYRDLSADVSLADLQYLSGKQLSYNNIIDIEAALGAVSDLPCCAAAVIKHSNSCGFATGENQLSVLENAWFGDPVSAFGSIIAFNRPLTLQAAEFFQLNNENKTKRKFIEVIAAPEFEPGVLEYLSFHKNLRVIRFNPEAIRKKVDYRYVFGALLAQSADDRLFDELTAVTQPAGGKEIDEELAAFGLRAVRNIKSNAIVIVQKLDNGIMRLTGMGAGQPNRLISTRLALDKTKENIVKEALQLGIVDTEGYYRQQIANCILVSDAYFPFADNVELAAENGIKTIIQPGGSIRDKKVKKRAQELDVLMIYTGIRHFRH